MLGKAPTRKIKKRSTSAKVTAANRRYSLRFHAAGILEKSAHRRWASKFHKQFVRMNIEGLGNPDENFYGGGTLTAFDSAHVIGVNVGLLRECFLAELRSFAMPEHCFADDFAFRFLSHHWLRKQNRDKVTTHAPCRMVYFRACYSPSNRSKNSMSEAETVTLIRGMRNSGTENSFQRSAARLAHLFPPTFPLSKAASISGEKPEQQE